MSSGGPSTQPPTTERNMVIESVLDRVTYELDERRLVATDNTIFHLEVNEVGSSR